MRIDSSSTYKLCYMKILKCYRLQSANRHKSRVFFFFCSNLKLKTALMRHWFMVSVYAAKLPCQNQIVSFFPRTFHIPNYPMKMILVEVIRRTNVRCLYSRETEHASEVKVISNFFFLQKVYVLVTAQYAN